MTLPQALAGRAINLATFWSLQKQRLSVSAITAPLNGGKIYKPAEDFSRDERSDGQPWGRIAIIPAATLWPAADVEPDKRGFNWQIRTELRLPTNVAGDPGDVLGYLQQLIFDLNEGWLPTPAESGLVFRQAIQRWRAEESAPDWDSERSMWMMASEWRAEASRP